MKNKILTKILILILFISFVGFFLNNYKFSEDKEKAFFEKYDEMVNKDYEPYMVEKELSRNIKRLSNEGLTRAVLGLVNSILRNQEEMSNKDGALQSAFKREDLNNFDFNIPANINKVKDETLKGFLKDVRRNHYLIEKYNNTYYIKPDFRYITNTYGKYLKEDLRLALEYTIRENMADIFDENTSLFKFDIIVDRIIKGEELESNYPDSPYVKNITAEKYRYYKMYFGTDESYSIYLTDNNEKVLDNVLNNYQETIKKYPDSQLVKDLNLYINKLKETDNIVTDDIKVWLLELTQVETIDVDE